MSNKYLKNEVMSYIWVNAQGELKHINNKSNSQKENRSGDQTFSNKINFKQEVEVARTNLSSRLVLSLDTGQWDPYPGLTATVDPSMFC